MSEEITAAAVRILGTEEELLPALCTAAEAGLRARLRRTSTRRRSAASAS